jgi:hypothetical protein
MVAAVRAAVDAPASRDAFNGFHWPWYFPEFDDYLTLLARSPCAAPALGRDEEDRVYRSTDALVAWLEQPVLVPFIAHLLRRGLQTEPFKREVVTRMVDASSNGDGTYTVQFRHLLLSAEK